VRHLIFLDLETCGLREDKDPILELAMVAVALPTFAVVAEYSEIVRPDIWSTVKRNLHEKVSAMHAASGLSAQLDAGAGVAAHIAEGNAVAFVREHAPQTLAWHTPLAGANPDFDRRFLRKQMPKLHGTFHYRNFDARSITQIQDWVFGQTHVESPHRALADCHQAIAQVKTFLGLP
jgi:oligoribonuclease (3'-5' exoribonuclease)